MEIIKSIYTFLFRYDGHFLIYNSESNGLFEVSEKIYSYIEQLNTGKRVLSDSVLSVLLENKILINDKDKYSYYDRAKLINCLDRFGSTKLTLNILPTTCCNFSCPYCFEENKTKQTISDDVIKKIIEFVNRNEEARTMDVMWYGGEPLLAFDKIKVIIKEFEEHSKLPIHNQSIVTNGYLFDKEKCEFFKQHPLSDLQITIDGTKSQHNKNRFTLTDHDTYSKIIENIDIIVNELPSTKVFIRINIDENNKNTYPALYNEYMKRWDGKNIYVYPGFIRIDNAAHTQLIPPSIIGDSRRNFYFEMENRGLQVELFPELRKKACSAVRKNAFIIGPKGEIYKCWNEVSDASKIIGYIGDKKLANTELLARYLTEGTAFDEKDCKDCFYFPICDGGCPQYRLRNKYENGKYDLCSIRNDRTKGRKYLTKCLIEFYERKRERNQIKTIN